MDILDITLDEFAVEGISQTVSPYLLDYLQYRGRSQSGLGLSLSSDRVIELHVGDVGGIDFSVPTPARMNTFMKISVEFYLTPKLDKVALDLIAHVPREEIVYLLVHGTSVAIEDVSAQFPNLRGLHFESTPLSVALPEANHSRDVDIFPSLRYIFLDRIVVDDSDGWEPLVTFLLRRARSGRPLRSLVIIGSYHAWPNITQGMVGEFRFDP